MYIRNDTGRDMIRFGLHFHSGTIVELPEGLDQDKQDHLDQQLRAVPFISDVDPGTPDDTSTTITFTTSEEATTVLYYRIGEGEEDKIQGAANTSHSLELTDLTPETVYTFRILAETARDGSHQYTGGTFETEAAA